MTGIGNVKNKIYLIEPEKCILHYENTTVFVVTNVIIINTLQCVSSGADLQ